MLYKFDQTNQWSGGVSLELSITEPDCAKYLPEGRTSNALELNSLQACPDNPTPSWSNKIQPIGHGHDIVFSAEVLHTDTVQLSA